LGGDSRVLKDQNSRPKAESGEGYMWRGSEPPPWGGGSIKEGQQAPSPPARGYGGAL